MNSTEKVAYCDRYEKALADCKYDNNNTKKKKKKNRFRVQNLLTEKSGDCKFFGQITDFQRVQYYKQACILF